MAVMKPAPADLKKKKGKKGAFAFFKKLFSGDMGGQMGGMLGETQKAIKAKNAALKKAAGNN